MANTSPASNTGPSNGDGVPPHNPIDFEMTADFSDDEGLDAEMLDDDVDPDNSISDKTVALSVAEGTLSSSSRPFFVSQMVRKLKPRLATELVATPSLKEGHPSPAPRASSTRAPYASALKVKPADWHLEFSMDNQTLPLDLTIYGAMHQHEMRKKTGTLPPDLIGKAFIR